VIGRLLGLSTPFSACEFAVPALEIVVPAREIAVAAREIAVAAREIAVAAREIAVLVREVVVSRLLCAHLVELLSQHNDRDAALPRRPREPPARR
jgi:hypothetical protein